MGNKVSSYQVTVRLDDEVRRFLDDFAGVKGCSYSVGSSMGNMTTVVFSIDQELKKNPAGIGRKEGSIKMIKGSPMVKDVFDMLNSQGMTQAQVAKALGISVRTLQRRIDKARDNTGATYWVKENDRTMKENDRTKESGGWNAENTDLF